MPESKKELKCLPMRNEEQEQAIMHQNGPMLVLAGPGSGKTYVITHRILNLIQNLGVPPEKILVITFTKAAANEMRSRAIKLHSNCNHVQFGTFHSVFYQILKKSNPNQHFSIITDQEKIDFISSIVAASNNIDYAEVNNITESVVKEISIYKNSIFTNLSEEKSNLKMNDNKLYQRIYKEYVDYLSFNHKIDFDDMLLNCYEMLMKNELLRNYWGSFFSYILIDEFQDINPLQYEIIKLLCKNHNIFVVGDDDQSIYSFRGAKPEIMNRFLNDYHSQVIQLKLNFRSTSAVVEISNSLIKNNKMRFKKAIKSTSEKTGSIRNYSFESRQEEFHFLSKEIRNFSEINKDKSQAILVRTNGLVRLYQSALLDDHSNTYELKEDLLAYLLFINCGHKRKDFIRIMNKPLRYISPNILTDEIVSFSSLIKRCMDKPWLVKRLVEFEKQISFCKNLDYVGQTRYICKAMGYENYFGKPADFHIGYFEFLNMLKKEDSIEMLKAHLYSEKRISIERFSIMTYHASKGLEFDQVYLPGLNLGKVPHGRLLTSDEIEEERRMFYVALTRAKENLVLTFDKNQAVSPFINEIYSSSSPYNSSNSTLSKYSSNASSTFSYSSSSSI